MREWLELLGWVLVGLGVVGAGAILWSIEPTATPFRVPSQQAVLMPQIVTAIAAFLVGVVPGLILLALSAILGHLERISLESQQLLKALKDKTQQTQAG